MKKKAIIIASVSAAAALCVAFGGLWALTPDGTGIKDMFAERVTEQEKAEVAERIEASLDQPAPGYADREVPYQLRVEEVEVTGSKIVDTTAALIQDFGFTTEFLIQVSSGQAPAEPITMTADECLLDWAANALPTFDGQAVTEIRDVCGREAAVFAGGYGMGSRDLLNNVVDRAASDPVRELIFEAEALDYASVATEDSKGVLVVVSRPAS